MVRTEGSTTTMSPDTAHQTSHFTPVGSGRIMEIISESEQVSLDAVRRFVDTVDGAFPDVADDSPRQRIIDSAFRMVEQLVGASNQLAQNIVTVTEHTLDELELDADGRPERKTDGRARR